MIIQARMCFDSFGLYPSLQSLSLVLADMLGLSSTAEVITKLGASYNAAITKV